MNNLENLIPEREKDNNTIQDELFKYFFYWKWFLLSVFCFVGLSYFYLRYQTPIYQVSSTLLIKDEDSSLSSELAAFKDLEIFDDVTSNIENEIQILKSRTLAAAVVKDLNLNISTKIQGRIKETEVYNSFIRLIPVDVNLEVKDTIFNVRVNPDYTISILNDLQEEIQVASFNSSMLISNNLYKFKLLSKEVLTEPIGIKFSISSYDNAVNKLLRSMSVSSVNKKSSVLKLIMKDPIKLRAIKTLDHIVQSYQIHEIDDKNKVNKNTSNFVSERLDIIRNELSDIDKKVETFKSNNKLTDISIEAENFSLNLNESNKEIFSLQTQLKLASFIKDYLEKEDLVSDLVPVIEFQEENLNGVISKLNDLILLRNRILLNSTKNNPIILNYEKQIHDLRSNLYSSIVNYISSTNIKLKELKFKEKTLIDVKSSMPFKERAFRDLSRQQSIKEALYLYLLQKQEETQINLAVTASNSRVIDRAYGGNLPIAPNRRVFLFGGFIFGILVPIFIIYLINLFDNKFHSRKDIEKTVKAPVLGDIPLKTSDEHIVVTRKSRTSTAEAFRLLRTNLDFMLSGIQKKDKTIMVTSTVSGEGKSFVSLNLAIALGLSGKKVALLELDLRAPKIPKYLHIENSKGVTNYILDDSLSLKDVSFNLHGDNSNVTIVASGIKPPNPAELLMHERVTELFTDLQANYDYVIVDTPPVNLVTDTLLLSHRADMFIYIARANYIDKRLLEVPQNLYKEKRLPNMAVLINGSDFKKGYGYGYGYGGYGGYGYGYGETKSKKWWQKVMS